MRSIRDQPLWQTMESLKGNKMCKDTTSYLNQKTTENSLILQDTAQTDTLISLRVIRCQWSPAPPCRRCEQDKLWQ